ncbi:antitoxin MazE-like protein [Paraburkholderia sp. CI3]
MGCKGQDLNVPDARGPASIEECRRQSEMTRDNAAAEGAVRILSSEFRRS